MKTPMLNDVRFAFRQARNAGVYVCQSPRSRWHMPTPGHATLVRGVLIKLWSIATKTGWIYIR